MEHGAAPVLVVDDDEGCRSLVATMLARAGYVALEAGTGEQALELARTTRPALVLLDVRLPGISGYETCRELKETYGASVPVFFLSGERTEPLDRAAGLLIGGDDYIVKPFDGDELVARIRRYVRPRVPNPVSGSLTVREAQVLRLMADGLNQSQIAFELVISPKTVATHIQRILTKLSVHSRAQAVALAHRSGLLGVLLISI